MSHFKHKRWSKFRSLLKFKSRIISNLPCVTLLSTGGDRTSCEHFSVFVLVCSRPVPHAGVGDLQSRRAGMEASEVRQNRRTHKPRPWTPERSHHAPWLLRREETNSYHVSKTKSSLSVSDEAAGVWVSHKEQQVVKQQKTKQEHNQRNTSQQTNKHRVWKTERFNMFDETNTEGQEKLQKKTPQGVSDNLEQVNTN